jgi:hypothetical protein
MLFGEMSSKIHRNLASGAATLETDDDACLVKAWFTIIPGYTRTCCS